MKALLLFLLTAVTASAYQHFEARQRRSPRRIRGWSSWLEARQGHVGAQALASQALCVSQHRAHRHRPGLPYRALRVHLEQRIHGCRADVVIFAVARAVLSGRPRHFFGGLHIAPLGEDAANANAKLPGVPDRRRPREALSCALSVLRASRRSSSPPAPREGLRVKG